MRSKSAHHKKGWKDIQSKKQTTERTKLALIVLAIVLAFLILSQAFKFTQMLFNPWKQVPAVKRKILWNGNFNINVLIRAKDISLLMFSPQNQKVTIVTIPKQTYLEVSHGFGKWQIASIFGLGGKALLKDTLINQFGLPIDGFLDFSGKYSQMEANTIVSDIRKNPLVAVSILSDLKTDLTPFELIKLKIGLSAVRFDKIEQIDLEKSTALGKEQLADGTEVLSLDTVRLDSMFSNMTDPTIQLEHKTIAIFNSTDHPQLAQRAARLITNIGGDVIVTSNGQNKFKTTSVVGEKSKTLDRLKQIFGSNDIIYPKDEDLVSSRAQINLFLGEDYYEQL